MYRILLVDDEPIIKVAFPKLIQWETTNFCLAGTANNGRDALNFMRTSPVDLVITDLKMPVMDGIELIRTMKDQGMSALILVLSNYSDFDLVRKALTLGACDYLLKVNITGKMLLEQLEKLEHRLLESKKSQEESVKKESLMEEQRNQLANSLLKEFFLGNDGNIHMLFERASCPLPEAWMAIRPVLVRFPPESCKNPKWEVTLSHLKDILLEIFGDMGHITILRMNRNELLCCLPSAASERLDISVRLSQVDRQISLYFALHSAVFYGRAAASPGEALEAYLRCREALSFLFYEPDSKVVNAESLHFSRRDPGYFPISLRSALLDDIRRSEINALKLTVAQQTARYRSCLPKPEIIREYWIETFDYAGVSIFPAGWDACRAEVTRKISETVTLTELESVLTEIVERLIRLQREAIAGYRKEIQNAILYIQANYDCKLSLEALADMVSLNRSYLCRLFKQETGVNIFQFINKIRMEKAAELIRIGDHFFVKEISSRVGIDDPFYFTRKFKEYFGVAPSEYNSAPKAES